MIWERYEVVVVGAGHAGAEAAAAAANLGAKTLLITQNLDTICQMSCNPAMGGVAKGQIVREIDALGGYSGIVTDNTMIQFRMLNLSKGPAMWSPRAQSDRMLFSMYWRNILEYIPNLSLWQDEVVGIKTEDNQVVGVYTKMGIEIPAQAVVLTNGDHGYIECKTAGVEHRKFEEKHYLAPIPSGQATLNPQIGQNPGW